MGEPMDYDGKRYFGFDVSKGMLDQARQRGSSVEFAEGDANVRFPYSDDFADLAFCVDVLHHLADHAQMFHELARTVRGRGCFIAVTDSVEDIEGRSLTHFFPETRPIELKRYPKLESLVGLAAPAGFELLERASVLGELEIDAELLRALGEKCASSLRLIDESAHRRGTERVLEAGQRGERWVSRYTVLRFQRGETPA